MYVICKLTRQTTELETVDISFAKDLLVLLIFIVSGSG